MYMLIVFGDSFWEFKWQMYLKLVSIFIRYITKDTNDSIYDYSLISNKNAPSKATIIWYFILFFFEFDTIKIKHMFCCIKSNINGKKTQVHLLWCNWINIHISIYFSFILNLLKRFCFFFFVLFFVQQLDQLWHNTPNLRYFTKPRNFHRWISLHEHS